MRLLRRARRSGWLWPLIVAFTVIIGALIVIWLVDEFGTRSNIRRGTQVSGVDIGGLQPEEATEALEPLVEDVAETKIELHFQGRTPITLTAADLGIALDTERTLAEAADPPRPVVRPAAWLFDLFATREVDPSVTTNMEQMEGTVNPAVDPETPRIEFVDGHFEPITTTEVPVPDMELLASMIEEAVREALELELEVVSVEVPISGMDPADPVAVESAIALAEQANRITAGGVQLQLEGTPEVFSIKEPVLREKFVVLEGRARDTRLALNDEIVATLASLFVGIGLEGQEATIALDDAGNVVISGGEAGTKCCAPNVTAVVFEGLLAGQDPIVLPPADDPHPRGREWAESLGIAEVVGEFTTNFKAGQDRVLNIARISELTRGAIIEPGQRFSVNEYVGRRTVENGFVLAGMIANGVFVDSVGGGISQYATTLFNAAFFAGLDFIEYQSHTIYLSRYPFGREATVSHPAPDLVLENNTPYGVMLWPTTTASSITVRLYSTPSVVSEQTNQWTRAEGTSCTRVTTERTRTWLSDGRAETDTVWARYRPEGLRCDGSPSVTTTTLVPPEDGEPDDGTPPEETRPDDGTPPEDVPEPIEPEPIEPEPIEPEPEDVPEPIEPEPIEPEPEDVPEPIEPEPIEPEPIEPEPIEPEPIEPEPEDVPEPIEPEPIEPEPIEPEPEDVSEPIEPEPIEPEDTIPVATSDYST